MLGTVDDSHFEITQELSCGYSPHKFTEYVSKRTGMRIVVVDQAGPKVQGIFAAATEIFDDSGSPHTLEHLIFMGSKQYPYKGLLDRLATRAYSTTNAWTATDHTAYTLETGGYAAFSQILPVYLEHVILPTLTDAACLTEVHHVDAKGRDAGVVYSEMQGCQNQSRELMGLRSKRLMYPEGVGFRYETGGMMEQLRVLTADRIRQFHRDMYQPKNLCVVIVGEVDHKDLLRNLDQFEGGILEDIPSSDAPFKRPWVDSSQPEKLKESTSEVVEFPEEDESMGEISIEYFGPDCTDIVPFTAMSVLLSYLAGSSASVLENVLVEKEQVASAVYYFQTPRPDSVASFTLTGVDTTQLAAVEARFLELLKETSTKDLDMAYMRDCIFKEKRQQMILAERSEDCFTASIISTFLFSKSRSLEYLATLKEFDVLEGWTEQQWRSFYLQWLVDAKYITILGKPSAALAEKLKNDEEARVNAQVEQLGEKGLEDMEKKLEDAKAHNSRPIPDELLKQFKVPPTDTIHFISTTPARAGSAKSKSHAQNFAQDIIDKDKGASPLFLHFEHIPSNFVTICILLPTALIPESLRPLLPLFLENLFNQPITRDGKRIEFEEVVKELERDTVDYEASWETSMGNPEILNIRIRAETSKYETAIRWISELLWHGIFDKERLGSAIAKMLADVPEEKRSGSDMVYELSSMVDLAPGSIRRATGTLVKAVYLKKVKHQLRVDPDGVISRLEQVKKAIAKPSNFRVLVSADIHKLDKPVSSWDLLTKNADFSEKILPLDKQIDRLSAAGKSPGNTAYLVAIPSTDSSFAVSTATGPSEPRDPRNPALMVAVAYLDSVEGPMWTTIRGTGLAYDSRFSRRVGRIEFSVYSSPDAFKAFAAAKTVVEEFLSGKRTIDPLALEGAISFIVLSLVNSEPTYATAAVDKFSLEVVKDLPRDWNDVILANIKKVTVDQILTAMKDMLLPLFTPESSNLYVTLAPIMEKDVLEGFQSLGYKPEVRPLASFQDDYGLEGEASEDEESEDDEGDDEGSDDGEEQ